MKYKKGYKDQKGIWSIGTWLKRFRMKRTCRKLKNHINGRRASLVIALD